MRIYPGEVFCLLGHNGAGKTTTINLLTGLLQSSGGNVIVNNLDLYDNLEEIREVYGLCPQNNIIFDHLKVEDHLEMIAVIKGIS